MAAPASPSPSPPSPSATASPPTKLIPVTCITGYIGAGKTTVILNIVKQLAQRYPSSSPSSSPLDSAYHVAWLKNEFGDNMVDSVLAKENSVDVKEILNGCLCCTLVGRLGDALQELAAKYQPDRIIVETSGSAYPAPIAWEIRRLRAAGAPLKLDSIVCVIDAVNFTGYEDKSMTAKLQAKYTDLILLNKTQLVKSEREMDRVLDDVYELNPETPKVRTGPQGQVDVDVLFDLDTKLFELGSAAEERDEEHHKNELDLLHVHCSGFDDESTEERRRFDPELLDTFLRKVDSDYFYRIKGIINLSSPPAALRYDPDDSTLDDSATDAPTTDSLTFIVNYAFGRYELVPLSTSSYTGPTRLTCMGHGIATRRKRQWVRDQLQLAESCVR